ncbi:MAG: M14 family metallopeptidase [Flavobacteriaceae bacterium]|nr:M14 family metallopeptidase [Flavobacteriaceae bacterium]
MNTNVYTSLFTSVNYKDVTFVIKRIIVKENYQDLFEKFSVSGLVGRYFPPQKLDDIEKYFVRFDKKMLGYSVEKRPIVLYRLGRGANKILIWSQMHGNESTTTKALLDLMRVLDDHQNPFSSNILSACTLYIVPMLNPDGAQKYTRFNAADVDLNRDAQALSQPESRLLNDLYHQIQPDFCFNLHDQRSIFSAGPTCKPATLSFLTPASDEARSINPSRISSMQLIASVNKTLQAFIPCQVGRYSDAYNINCVGDTFQSLGTATLLFEAGHFPGDYQREKTRFYVFVALCAALERISDSTYKSFSVSDYFDIPANEERFLDIIYRGLLLKDGSSFDIGIQYKEVLIDNHVVFQPYIVKIGNLQNRCGHESYNLEMQTALEKDHLEALLNQKATLVINKNVKILNGMLFHCV